jgi:hypothetical protein
VHNQDETDVDCGGGCEQCSDDQTCSVQQDCISLHCVESICGKFNIAAYKLNLTETVSATCFDGIKNQDETDIDCGGDTCTQCADNASCEGNNDCISLHCSSSVCSKYNNNVYIL